MKIKLITIMFILLLFSTTNVLADMHEHGHEEEGESPLMVVEHSLGVILAAIAVVLGLNASKKLFGKETSLKYLVGGIAFIGLVHLAEIVIEVLGLISVPEGLMPHIEHLLAFIGLGLFILGFYKLK